MCKIYSSGMFSAFKEIEKKCPRKEKRQICNKGSQFGLA